MEYGKLVALVVVPLAAHGLVILLRRISARLVRRKNREKLGTLVGLVTSVLIFSLYFGAAGMMLQELGVSLTAYLASASVVGLAVGFGSQGVVQDVVTGVTLVLSDRVNLGDMVEISSQTGLVRSVGVRFTVLENYLGAEVAIPNRTINNVVNYPRGYVRVLMDARLPADAALEDRAAERAWAIVSGACTQFPGICRREPSVIGRFDNGAGARWIRIKVRIWPGQAAPLDAVKLELIAAMQALEPTYAAWMVSINTEVEPKGE